ALIGIGAYTLQQRPQRILNDRLKSLGELTRNRRLTLCTEGLDEIHQGFFDAMWRFIEDQRARFPHQLRQTLASRLRLAGQETFETEAIRRQARRRQGSDGGTCSWHRHDRQ